MDWNGLYASRMSRVVASDIRERMKLLAQKDIIHLGGGLPDPAIFPYRAFADASAAILADPVRARTALQYAASEGHAPLREWLVGYMASIGVPCGIDNILILNGSQQGFDFVGKLLISPGDRVMVEMPSFIGALRAFDVYEPTYVALPEPGEPWPAQAAKFAYVGPDFRNPTGTCLTREERLELLDKAAALDMPIMEDGCYEKLRYEGAFIPSVLALDVERSGGIDASRVLYTGTLSKTIAPSLRVGWICGPAPVIRKLTLIKQASDLATSALNQMIALDVVKEHLDAAVAKACEVYSERCASMLDALAEFMPDGVAWTRPEGGLYIWMTLPPQIDGDELARRAIADHNVSTISGSAFYPVDPQRNTLRLSFSMIPSDSAREGIRRLGLTLGEMLKAG
ncbi:MAG: PLP-dependent aminotransferase family protein [Sphingomonadaceae bacterium]|nr:PLP-dependent aminotransferase family protein [Sphingomonadaceae bacterium]